MSSFYNQCYLHWLDANGRQATNFVTTLDQSDAVPSGLVTLGEKYQALAVSKLVAIQYLTTHVITGDPGEGNYKSVMDRCNALGRIATTGAPVTYGIVSPNIDIFLADHSTLDLENADVLAWIAALQTSTGDRTGNALASIIRGKRLRARGG